MRKRREQNGGKRRMEKNGSRIETTEAQVVRLVRAVPRWRPILRVCAEEAKRTNNRFAGAWAFWRLKERNIKPPNNLLKLVSLGILKKIHSARGGKRAYYRMPDRAGVLRALG